MNQNSTKALLPLNNSVWGVIVNPNSSNVYRHVLSFDSETLKTQYIAKELFNDVTFDWKAELDSKAEIALVEIDAIKANIRVSRDQYPNMTWNELLNKDFIIVKDVVDGVENYKYYAINEALRKGANVIEYTCELDVFFTYDIKDMFNNSLNEIKQAHSDRFKLDPNYPNLAINILRDGNQTDPIYNEEQFNIDQNILSPTEKSLNISYDLFKDILADELFACLNWEVFGVKQYSSLAFGTQFYQNGISFPYFYIYRPKLNYEKVYNLIPKTDELEIKWYKKVGATETEIAFTNPLTESLIQEEILTSPALLKNVHTMTTIPPFLNDNLTNISFSYSKTNNKHTLKIVITNTSSNANWIAYDPTTNNVIIDQPNGRTETSCIISELKVTHSQNVFAFCKISNRPLNYEIPLFSSPIYTSTYDKSEISIDKIVKNKHKYETKSQLFPFRKLNITNGTRNSYDLKPQLFDFEGSLGRNYPILKIDFANSAEIWNVIAQIKNYGLKNRPSYANAYLPLKFNEHFEDITNYTLPSEISAYEEWLINNKAQQQAGWMNKGTEALGGILGVATGLAKGNPLALIGGASLAMNSLTGINDTLAKQSDLKSIPNQITNTGSSIITDLRLKELSLTITEYTLSSDTLLKINEHFYKYGYNFNSRLYNINDLLKTRYYFNHIEASGLFESIKLQASASIKQLINDTLEKGLTIWNVRDINTFKGIKNYEYENVEMSLLSPSPSPSPSPKSKKGKNAKKI